MSESATPIPQSLWTDVCPTCGYSLTGLPSEGICPECGGKYDQAEIVLHGYGRGGHERITTAKPSRILWVILSGFGWIIFQVFQLLLYGNRIVIPIMLGIAGVVIVIGMLRRRPTDHPGLVQVRLNPRGCVQHDDLAAPSIFLEYGCLYGWLGLLIVTAAMIVMYRQFFDEPWTFGFTMLAFLGSEIFLIFVRRKVVRASRQVRDGKAKTFNEAWDITTPWHQVDYFDFNEIRPGSRRLSIHRGNVGFWSFRTNGDAVDIEFECPMERYKQLRDLLDVWMYQAKHERESAEAAKLLASIKTDHP